MSSYQRTIHIVTLALVLVACSCSPAAPTGPQSAGVSSRAFVGDAELEVRYRYEPQIGKEVVLYIDAVARGGSAGAVRLSLRLDGFTLVRGEPEWEATVDASRTETHQVILRAVDRVARVTVITRHIERDVELASDDIRFWVDEDANVVECQAEHEACKDR
jgi:hypothetical protein